MKVGIVCYPTYGGSGVVATELGKALADEGHEIHFITYSRPTRLEYFTENLFYHEVSIKKYPLFDYPPYELALAGQMVDVVQNEGIDLLHVHYAIPHASAAHLAKQILAKRGIDIPFITTLHGTDITLVGKEANFEPVVSFVIEESDAVTTVSDDLRKETIEYFKIKRDIDVIPNFIDLNRFKKHKKDHFKKAICPNDEKLLIHTSNFRKVKRVEDVIKVFNKVREVVPSKLLMVGDGPERATAEELSKQLCGHQDVRFLGKLEAIEEVLSVSDLFFMTSEKESFGLAALEAMACEVPVISTDAGGLPELNVDGFSGFLCKIGDIDDMAQKSIHILDDNNLESFKKGALARAKEFDISNILPMYEDLYERVMASQKQSVTK